MFIIPQHFAIMSISEKMHHFLTINYYFVAIYIHTMYNSYLSPIRDQLKVYMLQQHVDSMGQMANSQIVRLVKKIQMVKSIIKAIGID